MSQDTFTAKTDFLKEPLAFWQFQKQVDFSVSIIDDISIIMNLHL